MSEPNEIFEKLPDGVTLHDPNDGSIIQANDQFCDLLGYSRDELQELGFDDLHPDEPPYTTDRAQEYIKKAATEGPQTFEWVDVTKADERLPVEVSLRYTTINGGDRIIAVVRDIRERKRRERLLERTNQQLEEFASVVSHDLRNPLNVIAGHVSMAREEHDIQELDAIERAVDRMDELIDDLLTLARAGEGVGEMEPVELETIVTNCWRNVKTDSATVHVGTTGTVVGNRSQMRQLLENLFRNTVEHGETNLAIRVGVLESDEGFFVEDNGPGIPLSDRKRVFQAGYSTETNGTGFGLSIVENIANRHGWEVSLLDGEVDGARFEFKNVEITK